MGGDLEGDGDGLYLTQCGAYIGFALVGEAVGGDLEGVGAGLELGKAEVAGVVGADGACEAGVGAGQSRDGSGYGRAGGIVDGALDGAGRLALGAEGRGREGEGDQNSQAS